MAEVTILVPNSLESARGGAEVCPKNPTEPIPSKTTNPTSSDTPTTAQERKTERATVFIHDEPSLENGFFEGVERTVLTAWLGNGSRRSGLLYACDRLMTAVRTR